MNGFDIQSALEVAKRFRSIARRSSTFDHDRATIVEQLMFAAEDYEALALRIENSMEKELV